MRPRSANEPSAKVSFVCFMRRESVFSSHSSVNERSWTMKLSAERLSVRKNSNGSLIVGHLA